MILDNLFLDRPVLRWELLRMGRLRWPRVVRYGSVGWLFVQFGMLPFVELSPPTGAPVISQGRVIVIHPVEAQETRWAAARAETAAATKYVESMLWQQFLILSLLAPGVAAGALGREKEKDTLAALFGTQLGSWDIVTGKLWGRLAVLAQPLLIALPPLAVMAAIGEYSLGRVALSLAHTTAFVFNIAAASMLCSVWTRRTTDAILACYASIIIGFLAVETVLSDFALPGWLDPLAVHGDLLTPQLKLRPGRVALNIAALIVAGLACLTLAAARLRPAALSQFEKRPGRWLWAYRPAIGDDPVRWRERHVLGLAPLPWLRAVPTWMGLMGTVIFSGILAGTAIQYGVSPAFFPLVRAGEFDRGMRVLQNASPDHVTSEVTVMGIILVGISALVVGVRCSGSIAEEKRRKTWEDLILTPLTMAQIVRGKRWGVVQAALKYVLAYALPMVALASLGGEASLWHATGWMAFTGMVITGVALVTLPPADDEDTPGTPRMPSWKGLGRGFCCSADKGESFSNLAYEGVVGRLPGKGVLHIQAVGYVHDRFHVWLRFRAAPWFIDALVGDGFSAVPYPTNAGAFRLPKGYDRFSPPWSPPPGGRCYVAMHRACAWSAYGAQQWLLIDDADWMVYVAATGE